MAAAFAALVSLQNNLHLIHNHPRHSFAFEEKQIESLDETVRYLIDFMESYHDSKVAGKESAEALESRIARAAQAAEDVIESHVVDQILSGKTRARTSARSRSRFLLDVQRVIENMNYMRRKAINVKARSSGSKAEQRPAYAPSTPPTSKMKKNPMVGFDEVLLQLLDRLTGVPSSRQVIPIVGMGGIGKTTLVTNAYQHPLIVQHFDLCLWATISQQYEVEKITKELVSSSGKHIRKTVDESNNCSRNVGEELYKSLYGRRYLIVLDDMWSVEAWDAINFLFPDTGNGSRVVVTTRHSDVAYDLGLLSSLEMEFLDKESSWDLFCQKAFIDRVCPPDLEGIGKKMSQTQMVCKRRMELLLKVGKKR